MEVPYEDWTLNGEPIRDLIRAAFPDDMAAPVSEVTLLSERWVSSAPVRALERLLSGAVESSRVVYGPGERVAA